MVGAFCTEMARVLGSDARYVRVFLALNSTVLLMPKLKFRLDYSFRLDRELWR
jgi:ribosome-binding factor A